MYGPFYEPPHNINMLSGTLSEILALEIKATEREKKTEMMASLPDRLLE